MKIDTKLLEKVFLIFLAILFIYYLFLASKTNFLGEDESFYYYEGQLFSQSQYPTFLRLGTSNVFAVFVPLFYASLFSIFGSSLVLAKMISTLFGFLTIIVVYLIGKKINFYVGFFASGILLSMMLFTNFMLIAYVDVPTAFFSILIFYAALKMDSVKSAILTGAILALSFYTKDSEFFLAVVLILYSILIYIKEKNVKYLKLSLIAVMISIILFSPYVIKNIYYYNYPNFLAFNIIFNIFFHIPSPHSVTQSFIQQISSISDFAGALGWIATIFAIFGTVYIILNPKRLEHRITLLSVLAILTFLSYLTITMFVSESRYLLIIFPQIALIGGYFMWALKEKNKYTLLILIPIFLLGVYSSIIIADSTSSSVRFPSNYTDALKWIKTNTPKDSIIFTTYGGSVRYFAGRDIMWSSMKEFPTLMTTQNSTYIYDTLKKYNVSYILIWNQVISQDYIVPGSNIAGLFTYNFLNVVNSDSNHFSSAYQNQDDIIFKLL